MIIVYTLLFNQFAVSRHPFFPTDDFLKNQKFSFILLISSRQITKNQGFVGLHDLSIRSYSTFT